MLDLNEHAVALRKLLSEKRDIQESIDFHVESVTSLLPDNEVWLWFYDHGLKIEAIRAYRNWKGGSLVEAKKFIDHFKRTDLVL